VSVLKTRVARLEQAGGADDQEWIAWLQRSSDRLQEYWRSHIGVGRHVEDMSQGESLALLDEIRAAKLADPEPPRAHLPMDAMEFLSADELRAVIATNLRGRRSNAAPRIAPRTAPVIAPTSAELKRHDGVEGDYRHSAADAMGDQVENSRSPEQLLVDELNQQAEEDWLNMFRR